jgi:hypothetical protein
LGRKDSSELSIFAGNLPCRDELPAYRQRNTASTCLGPFNQPLAMHANWHVICTPHHQKQAAMWMSAPFGIGTVHISGEAIFR